jgi:hypothetical protein
MSTCRTEFCFLQIVEWGLYLLSWTYSSHLWSLSYNMSSVNVRLLRLWKANVCYATVWESVCTISYFFTITGIVSLPINVMAVYEDEEMSEKGIDRMFVMNWQSDFEILCIILGIVPRQKCQEYRSVSNYVVQVVVCISFMSENNISSSIELCTLEAPLIQYWCYDTDYVIHCYLNQMLWSSN